MKDARRHFACFALLVPLLMAVSGCGFQLRGGETLPPLRALIAVAGQEGSGFRYRLDAALEDSRYGLPASGAESYTLVIERLSVGPRLLSVDAAGNASEYELVLDLRFHLADGAGGIVGEAGRITLSHSYLNSSPLGMANQRALLADDLERQAVDLLVRRVRLQTAHRPEGGDADSP